MYKILFLSILLRFNDQSASLNLGHIVQVLKYLDASDMVRRDNNTLCVDFMDLGLGSGIDTMQFEMVINNVRYNINCEEKQDIILFKPEIIKNEFFLNFKSIYNRDLYFTGAFIFRIINECTLEFEGCSYTTVAR